MILSIVVHVNKCAKFGLTREFNQNQSIIAMKNAVDIMMCSVLFS